MFKKLREKITEEVQQTSLRLPISVQQSVQQLTQLSPFSGTGASPGEQKRELPPGALQDELLVDISDIRPAGHNKDLFSIDEDSHEGSPSKSGFQLVDLSEAEAVSSSDPGGGGGVGQGQGVAGVTFDPTMEVPSPRIRRDSACSSISDASGLFPIYEVPGVSFNIPQSDLESSSEWEDSGGGVGSGAVDRLSKDTVYQAYLKMRQRYHKYKGRYADLARAYREKEKESDKLRDILTKTQDKALRKVSELKEQCSLEQQAKAHLEQELRSDLEERDHKITALQTKVKILQEGIEGESPTVPTTACNNNNNNNNVDQPVPAVADDTDVTQASDNSSGTDNMSTSECVSTGESVSTGDNTSMADNVSVASHGSASTAVTTGHEAEELIEKLRATVEMEERGDSSDVSKHKSLLARCMENIRGNKERIATLTQERDLATTQLHEKIRQIDILQEEHVKELDSLRLSVESSALSMAETKKQLFEELQAKEVESERWRGVSDSLEGQLEEERSQWQDQLQETLQILQQKEARIQEIENNVTEEEESREEIAKRDEEEEKEEEEDREASVAAIRKEVESKISQLEARTLELKESRTQLEMQLAELAQAKGQLDKEREQLGSELKQVRRELEEEKRGKEDVTKELEEANNDNEEVTKKLEESRKEKEEVIKELVQAKQYKEEVTQKLEEIKKIKEEMTWELEETKQGKEEVEAKAMRLEEQLTGLQEEKRQLEENLEKTQRIWQDLEKQVVESTKSKKQFEGKLEEREIEKQDLEKQVEELIEVKKKLEGKLEGKEIEKQDLEKQVEESIEVKKQLEKKERENHDLKELLEDLKQTYSASTNQGATILHEVSALKEANSTLTHSLEVSQKEKGELKASLEKVEREKEEVLRDLSEKGMTVGNLEGKCADLDVKLKIIAEENLKYGEEIKHALIEKDALNKQFEEINTEKNALIEEIKCLKLENEDISKEISCSKLEKENDNQRIVSLEQENSSLKTEKNRLNSELATTQESAKKVNDEAFTKLSNVTEKMEQLNSKWAAQMKVKDAANQELSKKVSDMDENLKIKTNEYKQKMENLNKKLEETKEKEMDHASKIDSLNDLVQELEDKEQEIVTKIDSLNAQLKEKEDKEREYITGIDSLNAKLKEKEDKEREYVAGIDSLNDQLKDKERENTIQIDIFKSQLKERDKIERELENNIKDITEKYQELSKDLTETRMDLEAKKIEFQSLQDNMEKGNWELSGRVAELEADLNTREVELTSAVEKRTRLVSMLETVNSEKAKLEEEVQVAKKEVSGLKEEVSKAKSETEEKYIMCTKLTEEAKEKDVHCNRLIEEAKEKDVQCNRMKEEITSVNEVHSKTKEEMRSLSVTFEAEMTKAKNSYAKLKENFHKMTQDKEEFLTNQSKKITELENRETECCKQLSELQGTLSLREEKIEKLLEEKKLILAELEGKVEELHEELREKEKQLKMTTAHLEGKVEELEAQMASNMEAMKQRLERNLEETHRLEARVAELSHMALKKDELLVWQAEESEQKLTEAREEFDNDLKELENTWEQRLRCELDRLQKQHEENLASQNLEVTKSEQPQSEVVDRSHQRAVATRDATIAALKDEADQVCLVHEEVVEGWRDKYQLLERELAEVQHQGQGQADKLQVITASMEQGCGESATAWSWAGPGPGEGDERQPGVEERIRAAHSTCQALAAKVDKLTQQNQQLNQCLEEQKQEKEGTAKTIAMLEFNNEHNKNKVQNMELSHKDFKDRIDTLVMEKERLVRTLKEGSSSGLYEELMREKEDLALRLTRERDELERRLSRERNELEERLTREKEETEERYQTQNMTIQEQLDGLIEIRRGHEKQISQIEINNAEMHSKIGAVQLERDAARSEAWELSQKKSQLEGKLQELNQAKEGLEEQMSAQSGTIASQEVKLEAAEGKIQTMTEATNTLQNNILNLQKQVEGLNETCRKLARDLEAESVLRLDMQEQLAQVREAHRQLEEKHGTETKCQVDGEQEETESSATALMEVKRKCAELQARVLELETDKRTLTDRLTQQTDSPSDTRVDVVVEHLTETIPTNPEQRNIDDGEMVRLRATLQERDKELSQSKQSLQDIQERLRIAEVVSGEVEEQRAQVLATEARLAESERQHQMRVMAVEAEAERRVADTQQLCHQTISTAFDQQDNQTSVLVRQQQEVLREAQTRAKEKAAQLDSVVHDYEGKLKEKDEELCQFVQQYEDQLAVLQLQHEKQVKEVEAAWQARAEKLARHREANKQDEMDSLTQEWNKERRELERLTQVAAAAFRSGTESVELLKKQVAAQRRELEDVKLNHSKEVGELKALLELKRRARSGGSGGGGAVRLGIALEEAAEFEYLKNILYQYMLGNETQTLSKVLCAVVKFDNLQQQEILDHEEQRQSLIQGWSQGLGLY